MDFTADRDRFGTFWRLTEQLLARLLAKPARGPAEAEAAVAIHRAARRLVWLHRRELTTAIGPWGLLQVRYTIATNDRRNGSTGAELAAARDIAWSGVAPHLPFAILVGIGSIGWIADLR